MTRHETKYKKYLHKEEVKRIIKNLDQPYKLIFQIMAYMGLRIGEVLKIKLEDLNKDFDMLRVELEKSKILKDRIIPNRLKPLIRKHIKEKKPKKYLFEPSEISNSKSDHIKTSSVRWILYKLRLDLDLDDVYYKRKNGTKLRRITAHTFRRWFASEFYDKSGNDLILTKEVLGHKKIETTQIYITPMQKEASIVNLI